MIKFEPILRRSLEKRHDFLVSSHLDESFDCLREEIESAIESEVYETGLKRFSNSRGPAETVVTLESLTAELNRRGLQCSGEYFPLCNETYRWVKNERNGYERLIPQYNTYDGQRASGIMLYVKDFVDYLLAYDDFVPTMRESIAEYEIETSKESKANLVSFQSARVLFEDFMRSKGLLKYTCDNDGLHFVLTCQVVKEVWLKGVIPFDKVETLIRFIPYLILRPDCVKDFPEFSIIRKRR